MQQRAISNQSFNQRKEDWFVCAGHMQVRPSDTKVQAARMQASSGMLRVLRV